MLEPNKNGKIYVAGLGPGADSLITPQVTHALQQASDIIGYRPYVERLTLPAAVTLHCSDNREEVERGRLALHLASEGRQVVVVSSGDPGVFAMAAALFEAMETANPALQQIEVQILPGITAMLAASAALGAPLGHDFCAINLSDNLKPWHLIEKRVRLAAQAEFVMAFYNPRSKARPHQFMDIIRILGEYYPPDIPIAFARAVSTPEQHLSIIPLSKVAQDMADMRTLVLVGNSNTRQISRYLYTPRYA